MKINWTKILQWVAARMSEPSTWRGLIGLAAAAGVTVSPHNSALILAVGMGLSGFLGVVTKDPKNIAADVQAAITDVVVPVVEAETAKASEPVPASNAVAPAAPSA